MERSLDYPSLPSSGRVLNLPERHLSSSASATTPPSTAQRDASAWTSPALGSAMDMFNFTTAASSSAIPSYAPAAGGSNTNAASSSSSNLGDMAFSQLASQYASRNPLQQALSQGKEAREAKRIKVESPHSALDSIDSWLQFDEEADKFGSFEIDFSKQYNPANQPRTATSMTPGLGSGLYANPTAPFREEDFLDDSAFDHSLSEDDDLFDTININDQLSKIETLPSTEPQSSRSLYSTPSMGWEKSQTGIHPSAVTMSDEIPRRMGGDAWDTIQQGSNYILTPEERRRLLEIAMGPARMSAFVSPNRFNMGYGGAMQPSLGQEFGFGFGPKQGLNHVGMFQRNNSTDTTASGISQPNRDLKHKHPKNETPPKTVPAKRPGTQSETSSLSKEKTKSADRMAHNDVERKYRTNLKDKITELRNAVPALQQVAEGEPDSAQGISKVSKGTVLTKATEYIHQLEQRNKDIMTEHKQLMRRLQAFEALLNNSMRVDIMPSHSMALFDPRGFC